MLNHGCIFKTIFIHSPSTWGEFTVFLPQVMKVVSATIEATSLFP